MELSATQRVAVPPERVWAEVGDVERLVRRLGLRSVAIGDGERGAPPVAGREWPASVEVNGTVLPGTLRVCSADPPGRLAVEGAFGALSADLSVTIAAPSPGVSEVHLAAEARGRGVRGKMLMQALRLARPALEAKLQRRLAEAARQIEATGA